MHVTGLKLVLAVLVSQIILVSCKGGEIPEEILRWCSNSERIENYRLSFTTQIVPPGQLTGERFQTGEVRVDLRKHHYFEYTKYWIVDGLSVETMNYERSRSYVNGITKYYENDESPARMALKSVTMGGVEKSKGYNERSERTLPSCFLGHDVTKELAHRKNAIELLGAADIRINPEAHQFTFLDIYNWRDDFV